MKQFRLRSLLAITFVAICGIVIVTHLAGPVVSRSRLNLIQTGMKEADVIRVLGNPTQRTDERELLYRRWGNPGWVSIRLDDHQRVQSVDSESAFP